MESALFRRPQLISLSLLLLLVLLGIWLMESFINSQQERELARWENVLHTLADEKKAMLERWSRHNIKGLQELADNNSLRLYALAINDSPQETTGRSAQKTYLHNLISAAADRLHFSPTPESQSEVKANLTAPVNNRLMIVSRDFGLLASNAGRYQIPDTLRTSINIALQSGSPQLVMQTSEHQVPQIGFILPVWPMPALSSSNTPFATIVALQDARQEFYPLLSSFGKAYRSLESYLIQPDVKELLYVSPLKDDPQLLRRRQIADVSAHADGFALDHPGSFALKVDYRGEPVLVTSRLVSQTPWTLVQKIDTLEALQELRTYQALFRFSFVLGLIAICLMLVAAWWYGSSSKARATAKTLERQSRQLSKQASLLQAVTDSTQDMLLIVKSDLEASFANPALALRLDMHVDSVPGKRLNELFGVELGAILSKQLNRCLESGQAINTPLEAEFNEQPRYFHAALVPMQGDDQTLSAVLISLHDLTDLEEARMRQADLTQQLIDALMSAIDRHDPYSAHHSAKTAQVALTLAETMQLSGRDRLTLDIASRLCNLGKLLIPQEVLTKTGELNDEELALIRQEPWHAEELLKSIEFDGPVLETITQKHEYLDGSGYPRSLKDAQVLATSRILTVANDFVAMVSPRAYRDRLSAEQALQQLLAQADKRYDRQVVAALFHLVENQLDFHDW